MSRKTHPKKEIEAALAYAEAHGWRIRVGGSHAWDKMYCPFDSQDCRCGEFCITSIWSTPKNAGNEARKIRRVVDNCTGRGIDAETRKTERPNGMTEYSFVLKYRLSAADRDADVLVERLGAAGCTDALVGIGVVGRLALDFTREAKTARGAVHSALADVKAAIPSASLVEASPDLVGLTDIADLMGVARQSMRKLMVNTDFPTPVHDGNVSLWHLADVLAWLAGRKGYEADPVLLQTAQATLEVNVAREARRYTSGKSRKLDRLVA